MIELSFWLFITALSKKQQAQLTKRELQKRFDLFFGIR